MNGDKILMRAYVFIFYLVSVSFIGKVFGLEFYDVVFLTVGLFLIVFSTIDYIFEILKEEMKVIK